MATQPADPPETAAVTNPGSAAQPSSRRLGRVDWLLLAAVLAVAAATRLVAVADFPIYFFCDEAHQANLARDLVANGFRDEDGNLLPAYFRNVRVFNLGLSVYVHALPVTLFGKTVTVVRATSVAVGLLGTAALMLALKWFFGLRLWWAGGLVMAVLPAWFLHSRTAFETVMMVSFYAVFVLAYLLYREASPRWLPAAVAAGAATFFSYSNGQGVMFVSCLLLLVVDRRYHWQVLRRHRGAAAAAAVVLILVAGPYLRFRYQLHPEMMELHFDDLHSYWTEELPTSAKLGRFAATYLRGLSPGYWFTEDLRELERHRMLGYPHLPVWLAPPILLGLAISLLRAPRSPAHRLLLIGALAAPFSASFVDLRITRVLAMVVPATLAATVGLELLRSWAARVLPARWLDVALGLGLTAAAGAMTRDALVNGPRWFTDYGMQGMQWGARELFAELRERLAANPRERLVISHLWANNSNAFGDFFLSREERERITWGTIDDVLRERRSEVDPAVTFALTPAELERAQASPKLRVDPAWTEIPDPAGRPGFYLVRLEYTPDADTIFEAEREERQRLVEATVMIGGSPVRVRHPRLDMGGIEAAFDGDLKTLARTLDANPTRLELEFPTPRPIAELRLHLWTDEYHVELTVVRSDGSLHSEAVQADRRLDDAPLTVRPGEPIPDARRLQLTIVKPGDAHMHLREIEVLP
jgi:hypothetical protein